MTTASSVSSSPSVTHCLECNAPLSRAEAQGLCARCLLKMGLASQFGENSVSDAGLRKIIPPPLFPFDFGGYRMLRLLGRGGMGAVYEAEDMATGRRIALKVLGHSLDSQDTRKRFLREGRMAASINHPNCVYVYGTEEIEGTPVITMELVPGGTLHERVKEVGPLPVSEAVDTILEVIAGLEAAHAAGILHRDVKPSNCFVEPGGAVKIGDFGLSISTLSRGDSVLTLTGSMIGTPEYASPEQLRGDTLDLRSDIYAVGMTLYFLLTGRAAFQAENLVQLLATALDRPAPSPRTLRPEIPERLARIILRCLAKQSGDRFMGYADLREVLQPFTSGAPTPATLGLRFVAGAVDNMILGAVNMVVTMLAYDGFLAVMDQSARKDSKWMWVGGGMMALQFAYFALCEGRWGATPGKKLVRLRVGGADRNAPGILRASARALIFLLPGMLLSVGVQDQVMTGRLNPWIAAAGILAGLYPALLAVTARRRNGYATIVDLLTKTRVIQESAYEAREAVAPGEEPVATSEAMPKIGPYHTLSTLATDEDGELVLGYDTRLLRRVWIRKVGADTPPLDASRRNDARLGRLRWLQGQREGGVAWDAYEAPPGVPLMNLLTRPQAWKSVRHWLLDLAGECAALQEDGSTASFSLERVWITANGGAKLLDFRAPGAIGQSEALPGVEAAAFLNQLAISALEGRIASATEGRTSEPRVPVAIRARSFLHGLPAAIDLRAVAEQLRTLVRQLPAISRIRRFGLVAGCVVPALMVSGILLIGAVTFEFWREQNPDLMEIKIALLHLGQMQQGKRVAPGVDPATAVPPMEVYIAGRFGHVVRDPAQWSSTYAMTLLRPDERRKMTEIVERLGQPTPEALAEARTKLGRLADEQAELKAVARRIKAKESGWLLLLFGPALSGLYWAAALSVAAALFFRGGVLMRALGIAVVTREGADASRLRLFWRACVAWGWLALSVLFVIKLSPAIGAGVSVTIASVLVLGITTWSAMNRGRTLQDRLAGTWLVAR